MRTEFNNKLQDFSDSFEKVKVSENLTVLKETYAAFETLREEIFEWVIATATDEEQQGEYLTEFAMFEHNLWVDSETRTLIGEVPIFDESIDFDDIDQMFEDYGSYFQRYGCLTSDQIVSWDTENVLLVDEFGSVEIVKRPDVLLNV